MNATTARLEINVPFTAQLKFSKGLPVEGKFGPQMMYTLVDGQKLYVDPPIAERMEKLGGSAFVLVKKSTMGSKRINWVVNPAGIFPPADVAAFRPPPVIEPAYDDGEYSDEPSDADVPPAAEAATAAAPEPRMPPAPATRPTAAPVAANAQAGPSRMTSALCAAVDSCIAATAYAHTKGVELQFDEETTRTLAITIYISACKSGGQ